MLFHFVPGVDRYAPLGSIGVRLFFVLSGFLITRILLASREQPLGIAVRTFYARRFLRIFPLFYFALFVAFAINIQSVRATIGWHLAYLTNVLIYSQGAWQGAATHFWSLAVEEQFYLVWPWLILCAPSAWLPWIVAVMIPLAPLTRVALGDPFASVLPIACVDALGFGALLAITEWRPWAMKVGAWIGLPLLATTLVLRWLRAGGPQVEIVMDLGVAMSAAWFVGRASAGFGGVTKRILEWRPLIYLGTISYGVYVYHAFMPYLLGRWYPELRMDWWARFILLASATTVVAAISWRLLEKPFLRLKPTRIDASRTHRPVPASSG